MNKVSVLKALANCALLTAIVSGCLIAIAIAAGLFFGAVLSESSIELANSIHPLEVAYTSFVEMTPFLVFAAILSLVVYGILISWIKKV